MEPLDPRVSPGNDRLGNQKVKVNENEGDGPGLAPIQSESS